MSKFIPKHKQEQAGGGQGGGAGTETPPKQETPPNDPPPEEDGDQLDDLGYTIPKEEKSKEAPPEEKKPDDKNKSGYGDEPPKDGEEGKVSGYGDEPPPPKDEPPPEEKKPDDKKPDEEGEFKIEDKGDLLDAEVKSLTDFINKHKVSKELAQALVEAKKNEVAELQAASEKAEDDRKKAVQRQRAEWHQELKDDPTFGGENFKFNVMKSEKVIEDFMPNLKKVLTEGDVMLPPYVMRDLAKLADTLYSTENLKKGDPPGAGKAEEKEDANDPLAFYNS